MYRQLQKIGKIGKQIGIGLLELMLSISIIIVLLVMATRYYQTTHLSEQVNTALGIVQSMRGASAQYAAGQKNGYDGISMPVLQQWGLVPSDLGDGSGTDPWGGNISVAPVNGGSGFQIQLTQLPNGACNSLPGKLQNQADSVSCSGGVLTVTFVTT